MEEIKQNNITKIIAGIFGPQQKGKRLIWNGFKPDGTKNQYWENKDIDWELHLSGQLKQGGNLSCDGISKAWVIDIDEDIDTEKICKDAWLIDNKTYPFKSPSKRWHIWKFWHKDTPTKDIVADRKKAEKLFKNKKYKIDFGHSLPKENGSLLGINFPFNDHQQPYDPRGNVLTIDQFIHRYRFQNFPLIAAATGLKTKQGGRPATLCKIAALLEQKDMFKYLDEVIKNFGDKFTDTEYIGRIKLKGIHKKYINIGPKGISEAISDIVGFDYEYKEHFPEAPKNLFEDAANYEDYLKTLDPGPRSEDNEPGATDQKELVGYDMKEYRNLDIPPKTFIIEDLLFDKSFNFIVGPKGTGKSEFVIGMCVAITRGHSFLGKSIPYCYPVVYIDAEMYPTDPIDREAPYLKKWGDHPDNYFHMLNFSFQDKQQFPDLVSEHGQQLIKNYLIKVEKLTNKKPLLILDNLRSLSSYKENDSDAWYPIGKFLFKLRGSGFSSIIIDHMGKAAPGPRGSSSKTDWADLVLILTPEKREKGSKVMKVKIVFDKARGLRPDQTDEFFAQYDLDGEWSVVQGKVDLDQEEEVQKLHKIIHEWTDERHKLFPDLKITADMTKEEADAQWKKKWPNGNKLPTQKYLADKFGCSVGKMNKLMKAWQTMVEDEIPY